MNQPGVVQKQFQRVRAVRNNPRLLKLWMTWHGAGFLKRQPTLEILDCSFSGFSDFNAYVGLAHASPEAGEWRYTNVATAGASIVVDVGANYGVFSCPLAKRIPSTRVYAFEPHEPTCRALKANVLGNRLSNVDVLPLAVSSSSGIVTFSDHLSAACNRIIQNSDVRSKSVHSVSLDDFATEYGLEAIDFLKIDAEGADYEVLLGAKGLFERQKIAAGLVEVNTDALSQFGRTASELKELLAGWNYHLNWIGPNGKADQEVGCESLSPGFSRNAAFFPKSERSKQNAHNNCR